MNQGGWGFGASGVRAKVCDFYAVRFGSDGFELVGVQYLIVDVDTEMVDILITEGVIYDTRLSSWSGLLLCFGVGQFYSCGSGRNGLQNLFLSRLKHIAINVITTHFVQIKIESLH